MGSLYNLGETKDRAGVYRRYTTNDRSVIAGADDGTVAVILNADWGPLGEVSEITTLASLNEIYGNGDSVKKTAERCMEAGANTLKVVRIGAEGTKGTLALQDSSDAAAITLNTKYETNRAFSVSLHEKLGDAGQKEFVVYEGTKVVEKIYFVSGAGEIKTLCDAINEYSVVFDAVYESKSENETLATVVQKTITLGQNPTVNTEAYSTAMTVLEAERFNVLCVDSADTAVHATVHAFATRMKNDGKDFIAVVGEPTSVSFENRIAHAAAFNDETMVYVGGSAVDNNGNDVEGYEAAAIVAGTIASTPSNQSIVHKALTGMNKVKEKLKNSHHIQAIKKGCLMFSESADGTVWIESGVNTLINPTSDQDNGWKKIKRVKVRHELFDRIDRTLDPIVGRVNCDSDGIANAIKLALDVMQAMYSENKIAADYSFIEDPERPHEGDSAWFLISCNDLDSLEKIYLNYTFRYSANA